jgi:hypothetical protein
MQNDECRIKDGNAKAQQRSECGRREAELKRRKLLLDARQLRADVRRGGDDRNFSMMYFVKSNGGRHSTEGHGKVLDEPACDRLGL